MTIREIEEATGLPRANVRYYESLGLIHPARAANGYRDYRFGVPPRKTWREELSTDATAFGGTGEWRNEKPVRTQAIPSHGREQSIAITIPPLGAVILRGAGEYKKPKAKKSKAREELPA